MTPTAPAPQGTRTDPAHRRSDKPLDRITLPCSDYEKQALREVAAHRGLIQKVATRRGYKIRGIGAPLLRVLSLQQIVAEYERLVQEGAIAA